MQKYNRKEHKYEEYSVPDDWNVKFYSYDMEELVNCCQCGKEVRYGSCYTSLEVHNCVGLGYPVCPKCYEEEWNRRKENE